MLKKVEFQASSFDGLRIRPGDSNELNLIESLSQIGGLSMRPLRRIVFQRFVRAC